MKKFRTVAGIGLAALTLAACGSSQGAQVLTVPTTQAPTYLSIYNGIPSAVPSSVQHGGPVTSIFVPNLLRIPVSSILRKEVLDTKDPYINGVWVGVGTLASRLERYTAFVFSMTPVLFNNTYLTNNLTSSYGKEYSSLFAPFYPGYSGLSNQISHSDKPIGARQYFQDPSLQNTGDVWQAVVALNTAKAGAHWSISPGKQNTVTVTACFSYPKADSYTTAALGSTNPTPSGSLAGFAQTVSVTMSTKGSGYGSVLPVLTATDSQSNSCS